MLEKILNQLDAYMEYNKMEGTQIHNTFKIAFSTGDFSNVYLDKKTYPVLKPQMFNLMCEYQNAFFNKCKMPMFW